MSASSSIQMIHFHKIKNALLVIFGTLSLVIGIIGIILPILPTTPFLLLAAGCYARGSKRFYFWLINNKVFGCYIKNYMDGGGIPLQIKIISISVLWITILASILFFISIFFVKILLFIIAIAVSIHILSLKTCK
jgi:uncharacterized protein